MSMMLLAPLVGSVLWFLLGRRGLHKLVAVGCVLTIFVSFLCMLKFFFSDALPVHVHLFDWMRLGADSSVGFSFVFDSLSLSLGLVVTGVGTLIHLYATSYMHGDEGYGRFFSYLNLFIFCMLMLVLSDSL
jgi:NADH-quinone oxidoreductase subunit L